MVYLHTILMVMDQLEISIFSLNNVIVRITKIMNNLVKDSDFQSHFSVFKIGRIFPKKKIL